VGGWSWEWGEEEGRERSGHSFILEGASSRLIRE